ncbi:MAG: GIY-YIG nuclease family protein [Chloroflexota bacterium]|nr:GIY-YIG nuclease family protein [Chloroflexota bacterium]
MRSYYVYILSSRSGRLYMGVTNDLERRVRQHKRRELPGFTSRYFIDRLVYYEETSDVHDAIAREKELKGWVRARKCALIEAMNPMRSDLAADWT